ncbi:PREDICTED: uncharacterized protein LOC104819419 isoform X2 [Tarenaya hassleriana]|uniref:uncharacterized protein LOC104819419 isoform X2 n=1 Tax=Tarenaya hassleriana TaxID=28532 RepID=UPI00053C5E59|nr:PREDICTED: uncharacterized protein LOC104819419 isoform X2 [Tarenaya hassleriana]
MVLLCFVLDLRNISPHTLEHLKQSFLQLGNLYSISSPEGCVSDRIGLCYVLKDWISGNDQLKIAYSPSQNFDLRDFHLAVSSLPVDAVVPEINESGAISCNDLELSSVLSDQALYSWGDKDTMRKIIVLSSCFPENINPEAKSTLMAAADKCVSVEFLLLEQKASHLSYVQERTNNFLRCISDLDNCSLQTSIPDAKALHGLVKRWLQDLKDEMGEALQAQFIFKHNLVGSVNKIFCNFTAAVNKIIDGFSPCLTCQCQGMPLDDAVANKTELLSCPITDHDLEKLDVIENSEKVGDRTVLFMSSVQSFQKPHPISSPIDFNVIERTNLSSLCEGLIMGTPFIVSPSACHEMEAASEETDQSDLNTHIFQGLCFALYSMDQGLVCTSNCNMETMRVTEFHCYYILQPSENGPMLLRRLAGSEEVSPISSITRFVESSVPREIEASVKNSLLEIESSDYDPLMHKRGFHENMNLRVKSSLQFKSVVSPKPKEVTYEANSTVSNSLQEAIRRFPETIICIEEDTNKPEQISEEEEEDKTTASITKEWEQLIVTEVPRKYSPPSSTPKLNKQIDTKTWRILERLEAPKQMMRGKNGSPNKKPLVVPPMTSRAPSASATEQLVSSSQLMKPNFQRPKRKHH